PKTRILVKKGSQINCNSIIPPIYSVNNAWYKLLPNPVEAKKPEQLKPLTKQNIYQPRKLGHQWNLKPRRY
ncbi:hypothetical protein, partial [Enterobacter cloacae complex sp. 4DZ3-17B2]|uniref:hypothetical protein n=1 Tax=Enterobacter cloacae complex sp. 4DZ3-17B2 TaxID=2511990 RepID=UPI001CA4EDD1